MSGGPGAICAWCSRAGSSSGEIYTKDAWLSRGALQACSSCHTASYCSRGCQRRHWPLHKQGCAQLRDRWLATEGERVAAAEVQAAERTRQLELDAALVRGLVSRIELGLEELDPSASLRWAQKRPGRIAIVEVWLRGRKCTGFDTITRHSSVEATLAAIEFRMRTGAVGYGCPCHGFNMLLLGAGGSGSGATGMWTPCPYGGAGAQRGRAEVRAPAGSLPVGFVARAAARPLAAQLGAGAGAPLAAGASFFGFSCEPCDPEEARALAAERARALGAQAAARAPEPHPYELSANGFSCTPCDPADFVIPPGLAQPASGPGPVASVRARPDGASDSAASTRLADELRLPECTAACEAYALAAQRAAAPAPVHAPCGEAGCTDSACGADLMLLPPVAPKRGLVTM